MFETSESLERIAMTRSDVWRIDKMFTLFFICSILANNSKAVLALNEGSWKPFIPAKDDIQIFGGNATTQNHFHRMYFEDDFVLISARNMVYNVSLMSFTGSGALVWNSNPSDIEMCQLKQKTAEECQNYIRVIIQNGKDKYLICGTNAFRPLCRTYSPAPQLQQRRCFESSDSTIGAFYCEEPGIARCPYDPKHNSSAVYAGNRLFFATVADVSARDSLIFSHPLRTEQHDSQWLNDPDFVSSYEFGDKVYFFFREMAVENINCGKAVFSRVARVCTNDRGGERVLRNTWTSFFKARLNCSIPGEFPFYFDEIQSTSEIGHGNVFPTLISSDRVPMVYGVFTTPRNSLRGSAICAFNFSDIIATFEGPFKEQKSAHSNWLPVREADVPNPHPAKFCHNNTLSDQMLNFIKWHPLMDKAVPAFGGQPVIIQASFNFSFTQVAVDWQVAAVDHISYDVLFIGTDDGHVVKVINRGRGKRMETEVIEVLEVFSDGAAVTDIKIYSNSNGNAKKLVVLSSNEVRSLPLHRCHLKKTCSECVALKDPYCSWYNDSCVNSVLGLQSIETGRHSKCPLVHVTNPGSTTEAALLATPTGAHRQPICPPCPCGSTETGANEATFETLHVSSVETSETLSAFTEGTILDASVNSKPEIVYQEVKGSEPCSESASSIFYSSSQLAVAVVLSIIFSLIVGMASGYYLAVKRHYSIYKVKKESLSINCLNEKKQNLYEIEGTPHHNCNERCSALPINGKQSHMYSNELRDNSSVSGVSHADVLDRRKTVVHL